jgi:hypothetical protein
MHSLYPKNHTHLFLIGAMSHTTLNASQMHFEVASLTPFGLDGAHHAVAAAGVIIQYLTETQRGALAHIRTLTAYSTQDYMVLDAATRRNLELTETIRGRQARGCCGILDGHARRWGPTAAAGSAHCWTFASAKSRRRQAFTLTGCSVRRCRMV